MMIQITDYNAVSPLILQFFKRGVITNNFMTPEGYKAEILDGNLYYKKNQDLLSLYVRRDGFFMMYFYARNRDVIFPDIKEKVISEGIGESAEILENNGFSKYITRVKLEKIIAEGEDRVSDYKAREEDAAKILELMKKSFDKYSGWIPGLSEILDECRKGLIYAVKANGDIAAVLRSGLSGKTVQIKQICVSEKYRKKGLAKLLINELFSEHCEKKCSVWTGEDNNSAIKLYEFSGFIKTENISNVYMKG